MRFRVALLAALGALLVLPGATFGGSYVPPPGDVFPVWSPDGKSIAFLTGRGGNALVERSLEGLAETRVTDVFGVGVYPDPVSVSLSPDWRWVAAMTYTAGSFQLVAARVDGSARRDLGLVSYGTAPAWSPDSQRIAFRRADGTLVSVDIADGGSTTLASGGTSLAWSPDGTRVAYAGGAPGMLDIHVVDADGLHDIVAADGPLQQVDPVWSPDGTKIAFLTWVSAREPLSVAVASADGASERTYGATRAEGKVSWERDGGRIVYAGVGEFGLFRLDLETGTTERLVAFGASPVVSPEGSLIAFSGGGECRDRSGIYVARADGSGARRLTNDCRIFGTPRGDVIHGTPLADILVGLGGDDRLLARDSGYVGDTLLGGDGDDVLLGGYRGDIVRGGRGDDVLRGGNSQDILEGGPGRDLLDGGRGLDLIYARDGQRDVVRCGTNVRKHTIERDVVWADRLDVVSPDCEIVHRSR